MTAPKRKDVPDETPEERRRRLDAVFGEVLPETTADEREPGAENRPEGSEDWLKAQVPPHHG
ncbi:MAG TPA: hypothetical protein VNQ53_02375 [Nocardioides sp.]|nr:hypothetical protein [Nocardioides sp.]